MKLYGDVSAKDQELVDELVEAEKYWDEQAASNKKYKKAIIAKAYVCLAHDWFDIGIDERGTELILKADTIYPGYFKKEIKEDMDNDPEFNNVVNNITAQLIFILVSGLGDMVQ